MLVSADLEPSCEFCDSIMSCRKSTRSWVETEAEKMWVGRQTLSSTSPLLRHLLHSQLMASVHDEVWHTDPARTQIPSPLGCPSRAWFWLSLDLESR